MLRLDLLASAACFMLPATALAQSAEEEPEKDIATIMVAPFPI
jgi:hypothetical protein